MVSRTKDWLEDGENRVWAVTLLCLLGLVLRIGLIVALQAWESPNAMEHGPIAWALLEGYGFAFNEWQYFGPSSVQSPPYPLLLAGLFWLLGTGTSEAYAAALGINAVIGAATVALTYLAARAVGAGVLVGVLAAALVAVWPTQVYAASHAQAIAIITAASIAVIWLWYRSLDTGRMGPWVAFGLIGCIGALTEPVLLPPMALSGLLVFVWPAALPFRRRFQFAAVLLAIAVVVLGPWTARNYVIHGKVMPVKSTFWVNVWKGNNPYATGTDRLAITDEQIETLSGISLLARDEVARAEGFDDRRQYDMLTREQRERLYHKTDVEREAVFGEWAKAWIRDNPLGYLKLCGLRFVKTVWIEWDNPKAHNLVYLVSRTVLLALTLVGLAFAVRQRWRLGYAALVVGLALLTYTLTVTAARFILPYEPLALALASLVVVAALEAVGLLREPAAGPLAAANEVA